MNSPILYSLKENYLITNATIIIIIVVFFMIIFNNYVCLSINYLSI